MAAPVTRLALGAVSSLSNRIFLACTALVTLSLGLAFYFVNLRATSDAETDLRRGLIEAAALADQQRAAMTDTYARMARLLADVPMLKAAVETGDPPTVAPLAREFRSQIAADTVVLTDPRGRLLATAGIRLDVAALLREQPDPFEELSTFVPIEQGLLQVLSVPILLGLDEPDLLGRLTVGFLIDNALALRLKGATGSELAFGADGRILAASLPAHDWPALAAALTARDISTVDLSGGEFLALARPMRVPGADEAHGMLPVRLILRSRTERLAFLNTLRLGLGGALIVTLLAATLLSYAVARTMTRPLAAITQTMRDVAATGDLTRRVAVRSGPWDDEDARLLATSLNTLTESLARFQREAGQKERLSALGRLSTVIAHEVRNPLMIIRAALDTLRRDRTTPEEARDALADIDEEVRRLNRIVTEVLDFARPIRFELAETSLNDVCRASAEAAWAGGGNGRVHLDLDPDLPPAVTDGERLRTALVNILSNARQAVEAAPPDDSAPAVVVGTRRADGRVSITVADRGPGIAPGDMPHIFDPYFTTRRTGTGLGLPIARNIVEGLGGTLSVSSRPGSGTAIRIDLPLRPPGAPA